MWLSKLQKYILLQCYLSKDKSKLKVDFYDFYSKQDLEKNYKNVQDAIHKSLENLTKKDLLISFGKKTAYKWFIEKVKLTANGRNLVREIISKKQRKLPIK